MSSEHHPADARRRAEEWLTRYDSAVPSIPLGSADPPEVRLLRSLLAAITAEGEAKRTGPRCPFCESDRISRDPALDCWSCETCRRSWGEHPAPQTEPGAGEREDGTVPSYPWTWERVARRVGEEFARTGPDGYDKFGPAEWQDWMLSRIYAPRPAQDAVREAAETLRVTLDRTCGKYLGGPRLPLVNDLEEHAARLLAALDKEGA